MYHQKDKQTPKSFENLQPMPNTFDQPYIETLPDGTTFEMMPVKGGSFMMGSRDDDKDAMIWEKPAHHVELKYSFYMGKYPITRIRFDKKNCFRWRSISIQRRENYNLLFRFYW